MIRFTLPGNVLHPHTKAQGRDVTRNEMTAPVKTGAVYQKLTAHEKKLLLR